MSIWKLKILIFFSPDLNSIFLLKWSCKKILKLVKSLKDFVINGKQRWLLLLISLASLNETFVQIDWTFISFQFVLFKSTIAKISNTFWFNIDFFIPDKFFPKIKIYDVSFLTDAGKRFPKGVIL